MNFSEDQIQYIVGAHWSKRPAVSIAASVRARWNNKMTTEDVKECIDRWSLKHGGKPVCRKNWPCG